MVLRNIIKDRYLLVIFCLSALILIFSFIFAFLSLGGITTALIIHFDAYKGIDILAGRSTVFGILFSASAMLIINLFLADFLYHRDRFLAYILSFISLPLTILILIVISVIVSVN